MRKSAKHALAYLLEFRAESIRLARTSGKPRREIARDRVCDRRNVTSVYSAF
jgi:hypothetical protein